MSTESVRHRTFGQWLQWQLDRREWTKADLARRMGVANGDVSRWVADKRKPRPETLKEIAEALDVALDTVLIAAQVREPDIQLDPDSATAQLMPLIEKIDWDSDPGRLEGVRMILEQYLKVDRQRKQGS